MRRSPSYGLVHGRLRGLGDTDRKLHGGRLIFLGHAGTVAEDFRPHSTLDMMRGGKVRWHGFEPKRKQA